MKIPKIIKAGGLSYNVSFVDNIIHDGMEMAGETDHSQGTIKIVKGYCRPQLELTFFHELCHIVFDKQGLKGRFTLEAEEEIVDNISNGLYDLLITNKLLK